MRFLLYSLLFVYVWTGGCLYCPNLDAQPANAPRIWQVGSVSTNGKPCTGSNTYPTAATLECIPIAAIRAGDIAVVTSTGSGGIFYWSATEARLHNGGTLILPKELQGNASPPNGRWVRQIDELDRLSANWFGATYGNSEAVLASNTQAIQEALRALRPERGGTVVVPRGCSFKINELVFPRLSIIECYGTDVYPIGNVPYQSGNEEKAGRGYNAILRKAQNEKMYIINNSNLPYDRNTEEPIQPIPNDGPGISNEFIISGSLQPALALELNKQMRNPLRWGNGLQQKSENYERIGVVFRDEGRRVFGIQYLTQPDTIDAYAGVRMYMAHNIFRIKLKNNPNRNDDCYDAFFPKGGRQNNQLDSITLEGGVALALPIRSFKDESAVPDTGYVDFQWYTGAFLNNREFNGGKNSTIRLEEKDVAYASCVLENLNTTGGIVTDVPGSSGTLEMLTFARSTGHVGIGIPNEYARYPLTLGGPLGIQKMTGGHYTPPEYKDYRTGDPRIILAESFAERTGKSPTAPLVPKRGLQIRLDNYEGNTPQRARLVMDEYVDEDKSPRQEGHIGAAMAHGGFYTSNAEGANMPAKASVEPTSYNIKDVEVERNGVFKVNFERSFRSTNYAVSFGVMGDPQWTPYIYERNLNFVRIRVVSKGDTNHPIGPKAVLPPIFLHLTGGDY